METLTHCRYCQGEVDAKAMKCRHCAEWLVERKPAMTGPFVQRPSVAETERSWTRPQVVATPPRIAWIAAGVMVIGTFLPFFSIPLVGGISLFQISQVDGSLLLLAASLAAVGAWRATRWMLATSGLLGLAIAGYDALSLAQLTQQMPIAGLGIGAFALLGASGALLWSALTEVD